MTKKTKTRRCAAKARILSTKDSRIVENQKKAEKAEKERKEALVHHVEQIPSAMFFKFVSCAILSCRYNTALGPPFRILLDTNFINFSLQNRLKAKMAGRNQFKFFLINGRHGIEHDEETK